MWDLMLLLLFGRTIELTEKPIEVSSAWVEIAAPSGELEVLNGGAAVLLDVTSNIAGTSLADKNEVWDALPKLYPKGTIRAHLITKSGETRELVDGHFAVGDTAVRVILSRDDFQKDQKFTKVRLRSERPLKAVRVFWRNAAK